MPTLEWEAHGTPAAATLRKRLKGHSGQRRVGEVFIFRCVQGQASWPAKSPGAPRQLLHTRLSRHRLSRRPCPCPSLSV